MPTPTPTPSYSPTDIGAAFVTVLMVVLTVLAGVFPQLAIDTNTRALLMGSLTVLTVAGLTAYTSNRRIKHQTQAAVSVALARATVATLPSPLPPPPEPPPTPPFVGGSYVITPVVPGPSVTVPVKEEPHPPRPSA
jgi:hypothetical protein